MKLSKQQLHAVRRLKRAKMRHPVWGDHVLRGRRRFTSATRMRLAPLRPVK
jgi:hypothetical protein